MTDHTDAAETKAEKADHAGAVKGLAAELKVLETENASLKKGLAKADSAHHADDDLLRAQIVGLKAENEALRVPAPVHASYPRWVHKTTTTKDAKDATPPVTESHLVQSAEEHEKLDASWK